MEKSYSAQQQAYAYAQQYYGQQYPYPYYQQGGNEYAGYQQHAAPVSASYAYSEYSQSPSQPPPPGSSQTPAASSQVQQQQYYGGDARSDYYNGHYGQGGAYPGYGHYTSSYYPGHQQQYYSSAAQYAAAFEQQETETESEKKKSPATEPTPSVEPSESERRSGQSAINGRAASPDSCVKKEESPPSEAESVLERRIKMEFQTPEISAVGSSTEKIPNDSGKDFEQVERSKITDSTIKPMVEIASGTISRPIVPMAAESEQTLAKNADHLLSSGPLTNGATLVDKPVSAGSSAAENSSTEPSVREPAMDMASNIPQHERKPITSSVTPQKASELTNEELLPYISSTDTSDALSEHELEESSASESEEELSDEELNSRYQSGGHSRTTTGSSDDFTRPILDPNDMDSDDCEYTDTGVTPLTSDEDVEVNNKSRRGSRQMLDRKRPSPETSTIQTRRSTRIEYTDSDSEPSHRTTGRRRARVTRSSRHASAERKPRRQAAVLARESTREMWDELAEIFPSADEDEGEASAPKRRGRPPGSKTKAMREFQKTQKVLYEQAKDASRKGSVVEVRSRRSTVTTINGSSSTVETKTTTTTSARVIRSREGKDGIHIGHRFLKWDRLDEQDRSGRTFLFKAVTRGDEEACRNLVEAGANVHLKDNAGWTALHEACLEGHHDIAALLIQYGADVNVTSDVGDTPLHDAVERKHKSIVELLLRNGASINAKNSEGVTPFMVAEDGMRSVIKQWLDNAHRVLSVDRTGRTPLHHACEAGDLDKVRRCLGYGADIGFEDNEGWTALHEAALKGHVECVEELLAYGAEVNASARNGDTPLHDAVGNGHVGVVKVLLEYGGDKHVRNVEGKIPGDLVGVGGEEVKELLGRDEEGWEPYRVPVRRPLTVEESTAVRANVDALKGDAEIERESASGMDRRSSIDSDIAGQNETIPGQRAKRRKEDSAKNAYFKYGGLPPTTDQSGWSSEREKRKYLKLIGENPQIEPDKDKDKEREKEERSTITRVGRKRKSGSTGGETSTSLNGLEDGGAGVRLSSNGKRIGRPPGKKRLENGGSPAKEDNGDRKGKETRGSVQDFVLPSTSIIVEDGEQDGMEVDQGNDKSLSKKRGRSGSDGEPSPRIPPGLREVDGKGKGKERDKEDVLLDSTKGKKQSMNGGKGELAAKSGKKASKTRSSSPNNDTHGNSIPKRNLGKKVTSPIKLRVDTNTDILPGPSSSHSKRGASSLSKSPTSGPSGPSSSHSKRAASSLSKSPTSGPSESKSPVRKKLKQRDVKSTSEEIKQPKMEEEVLPKRRDSISSSSLPKKKRVSCTNAAMSGIVGYQRASTSISPTTLIPSHEMDYLHCLPLYTIHLPNNPIKYMLDFQIGLYLGYKNGREFLTAYPDLSYRVGTEGEKLLLERMKVSELVYGTIVKGRPEMVRWAKTVDIGGGGDTTRGDTTEAKKGLRFSYYDVNFLVVADVLGLLKSLGKETEKVVEVGLGDY